MNITSINPMGMKPRVSAPVAPRFAAKQAIIPVITVQGNAVVERKPDMMAITLNIVHKGAIRKDVHEETQRRALALKKAIQALPFKVDIQPQISVQELLAWEHDPQSRTNVQVSKGFQGTYALTVTEKGQDADAFADHAQRIADLAEHHNANIQGPRYSLTPETREEAQREADAVAYENALKSAQATATRGNFEINDRPLDIKTGYVSSYQPVHAHASRGEIAVLSASADMALDGRGSGGGAESIFAYQPIEVHSKPVQVTFQRVEPKQKRSWNPLAR